MTPQSNHSHVDPNEVIANTTAAASAPRNGGNSIQQKTFARRSASPPWHAVVAAAAISVMYIPMAATSLATMDEMATMETFTSRLFPNFMSIQTLGWIRLAIASFVWAVTFFMIYGMGTMWKSIYLPRSKLQSTTILLERFQTLTPFAAWSWILLGLAFSMTGTLALVTHYTPQQHSKLSRIVSSPRFLRTALIVWELGATSSILTSAIVTYALWPVRLKRGGTAQLKERRQLIMNNVNVVITMTEVCLLGGIPVRWVDATFAPLLGIVYLLFSWYMTDKWSTRTHEDKGPQFLYFFLDTTLGYRTTMYLILLLIVLQFSYLVVVVLQTLLDTVGGTLTTHAVAILGVCSLVCRFRA